MTDQNTEALKHCPFCKSKAKPKLQYSTLGAGCWVNPTHTEDCIIKDVTHVWGKTEAEAIAAWNTRVPDRFNEGLEAAAKAAHKAISVENAGYADENQRLLARAEREMKLEVHKAILAMKETDA